MKKTTRTLLSLGAFSAVALLAYGQDAGSTTMPAAPAISGPPPEFKLVTVDLKKLCDNHYETIAERSKLNDAMQQAQQQVDQMTKDYNALVAQYKDLDDQSKNPTATEDAKSQATTAAQKLGQQIYQKRQDADTFVSNARANIQQRWQTFNSMILDEIGKTVVTVAKRHNATLVIDKSGPSLLGVSAIVYSDPAYDITDEVMAEINKNRPPEAPGAPTSSMTAPASAPAPDGPHLSLPDAGTGPAAAPSK